VAVAVILGLPAGLDLIGYPRLVRLNPNVPWKTRGNGALALQVGHGSGEPFKVGVDRGKALLAYPDEQGSVDPSESLLSMIEDLVLSLSRCDDDGTNPGIVLAPVQPPNDLYNTGVSDILDKDHVQSMLPPGSLTTGMGNRRGLIGASAAVSWRPEDRTYEFIAYRDRDRWGTPRREDIDSLMAMEEKFPSTFDNLDPVNGDIKIFPHTPCPILFGIRGNDPDDLPDAASMIQSEDWSTGMLFESNQGTDDHLRKSTIGEVRPFQCVRVEGVVNTAPVMMKGGHVIISLAGEDGEMDCAAYEPTKQFREHVQRLVPGDLVEVCGGVREEPLTLNMEKFRVRMLVQLAADMPNPRCPRCNRAMESVGRGKGYRCRRCRTKDPGPPPLPKNRGIDEIWYEVPPCARRHLSKPLRRDRDGSGHLYH